MEIKTLEEEIAEHPFFEGLSSQTCALIAGCGRNVQFDANETIYKLGMPADTFYVIRHGNVALEMPVAGKPMMFETVDGGSILNAGWLVAPHTCRSDARALETTRAIAFDAVCLRGKCDDDPAVGYALMKRFVPIVLERLNNARLQAMDVYDGGNVSG